MSKNQSNLRTWLKLDKEDKDKKEELRICNYFYLEWTNNYSPTKCGWYINEPLKTNYKISIKWKNKGLIHVVGNINYEDKFSMKEKKYSNVSYIKSLLQKAIRRGDEDISIKCAFHFIKMDIVQFLRRLLIIMIEDVIIHHSFNVILWLMVVVSKDPKFKLNTYMIKYLIGVIYVLVHIKKKKILNNIDIEPINELELLNEIMEKKNRSIIYSLLFRKSYGGLKGDLFLIDKYVMNLIKDLNNIGKYYNIIVRPIELIMDELNLDEWIIDSIDFHVDKRVIEYIMKKHNLDYNTIKKLIWNNCSKLNYRVKQSNYNYVEFKKIEYDLRRIQYYLLQLNY